MNLSECNVINRFLCLGVVSLLVSGCVASTPTQPTTGTAPVASTGAPPSSSASTTTRRPPPPSGTRTASRSSAPSGGASTATRRRPPPSGTSTASRRAPDSSTTTTQPSSRTPEQQDVVASIAQGITTALLGDSATPSQSSSSSTPTRARQPASTTTNRARQPANTTTNRARQPASSTTVETSIPRVGAVMTEYGEVWADESCSWAEVNGVYGEIYNFDGELWVMDDAQNYLAQVPPGVAQCQAYMQTAAVSPTDPTTDPVWQGSQPGAQGDIWIDENCEWADVGGYTGYVAEVDGYLYIYSEAGDYMADLPPGMFPQCGY